ncbi:MAG: PEP/pyruvate-binding domain-containing protein [Candidatus Marinimicrobia bacterium]|nr:PEP/pyruvate-binding domain-containing protein [Candidatus Neomarinimicrobiota bacterium]MDD5582944.1 PEP/pyruvate-binding domain-containing protein [Candidatus Neomarinimicrobiota bacterium]
MQQETYEHLKSVLKKNPALAEKIIQNLLIQLHNQKIVSIDKIYKQSREMAQSSPRVNEKKRYNPNAGIVPQWDKKEKEFIRQMVIKYASEHFTPEEIDRVVNYISKTEKAFALENIANLPGVSFWLLAEKVHEFCNLPEAEPIPLSMATGIRVALLKNFISDNLQFIRIARKYIRITDLDPIIKHTLGSETGSGKIGGKAAGLILAYKILTTEYTDETDYEYFREHVHVPESYYLRTDVFEDFLAYNGFVEYQNQKYKSMEEIQDEYPLIRELFKNADFPPVIKRQLRNLLEKVGEVPLIVRSSSLLEDNFETSFSGKYDSIFLANQGSLNKRLSSLIAAIGEVYSSGFSPDTLEYRKEHDLLDYFESIAILIQKVVGEQFGDYFFPLWAGVAFGRNEYRWTKQIKYEDGLVRLVFGMGTRAVDRVSDYPRMIGLTKPMLRPESTPKEIKVYSQKNVDVIDLKSNTFVTLRLDEILDKIKTPELSKVISIYKDDDIFDPIGTYIYNPQEGTPVITFNNLLKEQKFPELMSRMLKKLEKAYNSPVDLEFAYANKKFYLLQCRPLVSHFREEKIKIPENIPQGKIFFHTERDVPSGVLKNIEYIIYCDPLDYNEIPHNDKFLLARVIGKLNRLLEAKRFILLGPGRWGSSHIELGIPTHYSDINKTKMIIEIARESGGYTPEVSYGTHFFQDLVEANIFYLPIYPDLPTTTFNPDVFKSCENMLGSLLPTYKHFEKALKVYQIPRCFQGQYFHVYMDRDNQKSLGFISPLE